MDRKTVRRVSLVLALILCASLAAPSAGASPYAAQDASDAPEESVPLVNVIETPLAETSEPDGIGLTGESGEPLLSDEPAPADPAPESTEGAQTDGDGPDDGAESFTVSYYAGGSLLGQETVARGALPAAVPAYDAAGAAVRAWRDAEGRFVSPAETAAEADAVYYVWYVPSLETGAHNRYVNGTGSAKFSPGAALTRAQAALILYTLLQSRELGPFSSAFSDVPDGTWYTDAVRALASYGVINGYADGTFRPTNPVTRAEFVTMLVNLTGVSGGSASFTDVSGHWAAASIAAATGMGWLSGYAQNDGTYIFRPQRGITRAEAVVVMNRVLGRSADSAALAGGQGILHYLDVSESYWAYGDIMEASIGHAHTHDAGGEKWTSYNVESCGLAAGMHKISGALYYVNANEQLAPVGAGLSRVGDRYVYAKTAGYAIAAELDGAQACVTFADGSTAPLTDGFNRIDTTLFYWDAGQSAPRYLTAGLNPIDGKTYWADAEGYVIKNTFGRGVVTLGGKKYLSDGACAVITSGEGYVNGTSLPTTIDLKNQTYEFDGHMYYLQEDYSLLSDGWAGLLYFGGDCRYTSGDAELDAMVDRLVYSVIGTSSGGTFYPAITNNALSKTQKLMKVYYYLRGGEGAKTGSTEYSYRPVTVTSSTMLRRARFNEQRNSAGVIQCAKEFFSRKYGICYQWGCGYLCLARRLGFQAYVVVGGLWSYNNDHCWNMIQWDGAWHISDVEIEWGHLSGYYENGRHVYRNLFDQTLSSEWVTYYKHPECSISYTFPY